MEVKINAIHFDATEKLNDFIDLIRREIDTKSLTPIE